MITGSRYGVIAVNDSYDLICGMPGNQARGEEDDCLYDSADNAEYPHDMTPRKSCPAVLAYPAPCQSTSLYPDSLYLVPGRLESSEI